MQGYQWDQEYEGEISNILNMCEGDDWREVFRQRTLICTPEQAAERIKKYLELGFTEIAIIPRYAGITHDQAMTTIQRINDDVLPILGISNNKSI